MKCRFYTSLLLGVGLVFVTPSGSAKPAHHAHKRQVQTASKPAKKSVSLDSSSAAHAHNHSGLVMVKRKSGRGHGFHKAIIEFGDSGHDLSRRQKRQFGRKKLPKAGRTYFEKVLPSPVTTIPHLPSQNALINTSVEPAESAPRIHSFIPNGHREDAVMPEARDESGRQYTTAHGVVLTTLSDAAAEADLSEELLNQLTNIFAWDVDFATNLHVGDEFIIIYESDELQGEKILAAEFVTGGRVLTAIRYEDADGNANYFTPEGKAMRKAFLSTPVDYARITSRFSANRRHPILNRIRAHKGVDYAARTGTPVKATGDGTIAFLGNRGGYGQVVAIRHGERFETLYAHLSGFNSEIYEGATVKQGDIIGYVGQTGLATGPHLHYEFRVDGLHRNPETISSGSRNAMAMDADAMQDFKNQSHNVVAQLYTAKAQSLFAKNQSLPR